MLYLVDRLTRDVGCYFSVLGIYFAHTTERKILRMKFNEKLIEIRKKQGLSQEELGMELQVSRQTISKWETGRSFPDITLLESLCETFDITVSELLSGKKIESEDYKRETERLLIQCIGEKRLRGFQIGIYLLGLVTIILGGIGFGIWGTHISWKIGSVPIKWILLAAALITFGVMAYFDRNLPGKNYRSSIIWLECIVEAFTLACIFGNSIISFWDIDNMTENIVFILIIAVIMLCLFATRIIAARTNREEYEMQKNAGKHETEQ